MSITVWKFESFSVTHILCGADYYKFREITQCGNFRIFLSFRFYVKSILAHFKRSKTAISTILRALNFDF